MKSVQFTLVLFSALSLYPPFSLSLFLLFLLCAHRGRMINVVTIEALACCSCALDTYIETLFQLYNALSRYAYFWQTIEGLLGQLHTFHRWVLRVSTWNFMSLCAAHSKFGPNPLTPLGSKLCVCVSFFGLPFSRSLSFDFLLCCSPSLSLSVSVHSVCRGFCN